MATDLEDMYESRVKQKTKHKPRHTYPNPRAETPRLRQRNMSFPSLEDESSEKCVIKEYSKNRLKKEIVITKRTKIHPMPEDESEPAEEDPDSELVTKCLALVGRKILRLMCYLILL